MERFWYDMRHAARRLRRAPAFTAVAAACIALGVGATTTMLGAAHAILMRVGTLRRPVLVFLLAALLVLTIGAANVGNLVLARGTLRRHDTAVAIALGAERATLAGRYSPRAALWRCWAAQRVSSSQTSE